MSQRNLIYLFIFFIPLTFFLLFPHRVTASPTRTAEVKIFDAAEAGLDVQKQWRVFEDTFLGGASVASGDVLGDGLEEIIVASGPSRKPTVQIFNDQGIRLKEFFVFTADFVQGVTVATGNIDGKGKKEIIVGTGIGGGPLVQIYDADGKLISNFFAFNTVFRGGVNVASGDVTGDGRDEIIVAAGSSGGPHVRVFNNHGQWIGVEFFPFASDFRGGVSVATANVDGGEKEEIVMAAFHLGPPRVKVYRVDEKKTVLADWLAFPDYFKMGVNLTGADIDLDGVDEIIVSANTLGGPHVRVFKPNGVMLPQNVFAYETDFRGGVWVAAGNVDRDKNVEIITTPNSKLYDGRIDLHKYIEVDLAEQRLYAYESGRLMQSFLISSGTKKYPTPEGEFSVWRKREKARLTWEYGLDHPDNYDLPDVPWIVSFSGPYTIHGTYWHRNFGHPMSHGCVNAPTPQAKWMYDWADYGTPVFVHK